MPYPNTEVVLNTAKTSNIVQNSPNDYLISGWGQRATKAVTFSNTSGTVNLFTVTGDVVLRIIAVCTTNLASAAAGSISVGIAGTTDAILPVTLATDIDAREIWKDNAPASEIEAVSSSVRDYFITDGNDVILTCSAQIDSGAITFYGFWVPASSDGAVTAA